MHTYVPPRCARTPARLHASPSVAERSRAGWLVETNVADEPVAEKRGHAKLRAVHKLIGNQKLHRLKLLLQRTDRAHGNNSLDAKQFHGVDIRAEVNLGRQNAMAAAVTRQKRHPLPFQSSDHHRVGRLAKRSADLSLNDVLQAGHRIKAAATDDSDFRVRTAAGFLRLTFRHLSGP